MPRPRCLRRIACRLSSSLFKPAGVPAARLQQTVMTLDELEALRLADLLGFYHEAAALQMKVSRQTFGRIIESAHRKVADALIHGKALQLKGGDIEMAGMRTFRCSDCRNAWQLPFGTGRPGTCPACGSENIRRTDAGPRQVGCRRGRNSARRSRTAAVGADSGTQQES
jgi:predicted DNA-binding protein (UPF0251 family)